MIFNGRIKCAKCSKPVDRVTQSQNMVTGDVTFTAFCHGEKESTVLSIDEIQNAVSIDAMYAFIAK